MVESFEKFAKEQTNKKLFEQEDSFSNKKPEFQEQFLFHFKQMCGKIKQKQENGMLPQLSFLEYTLLYHRFMKRSYLAEVRIYGEDWYLDPDQEAVGLFDVSILMESFTELWEELLCARKSYAGSVRSQDVEEVMLSALPKFYAYVVSAIRFCILSAVEGEEFQGILRAEEFSIQIVQYMGNTESVYKESANKDREYYLDWFRKRLDYRRTESE